jgi:hypothetical protein
MLKALRSSELPKSMGKIGNAPFTTMGVTQNYSCKAHDDPSDAKLGFIFRFNDL